MSQTDDQDLRLTNESIRAAEPGWALDASSFEEVLGHIERAMPGALELLRREGEPTPRSPAARIRNEVGGGPDWPWQPEHAAQHDPLPNLYARRNSSWGQGR
jgi:hypothetical protein